jgi:hypothetical protein
MFEVETVFGFLGCTSLIISLAQILLMFDIKLLKETPKKP